MKSFLLNPYTWILFLLALLPRLFDLGQFLTSDENTNIFLAGSAVVQAFLRGDFRGTYWHFYPGVTISWADGLGLAGQWLLERLNGATSRPFTEFIEGDIRHLLVAARLPYALLTAFFVPVVYHLLRRWLDPSQRNTSCHYLSIAAALLIAFDPFFLAHSRVVHGDAPVSVFMIVSILSLFLYLRDGGRGLFVLSAASGSMAALTKAPGQLMALLVIIFAGIDWLMTSYRVRRLDWRLARRRLLDVLLWGVLAFGVMVLLWPSMWVAPLDTLGLMLDETLGKVNEGHLVFFQGQPTLDPGPWFYLIAIPFRLTPLTSVGAALSLGMLAVFALRRIGGQRQGSREAGKQRGRGAEEKNLPYSPTPLPPYLIAALLLLWTFVLLLLLSGNASPKKQDRYLLPVFPAIDMLAALGWFGLFWLLAHHLKQAVRWLAGGLLGLAMLQLLIVLPYHPYYLAYFNPLMGGLPRAVETTLVGWGEGMEQAAAYLNQKPDAASLVVASTPSQTLLPYFKGQGENFYTNDVAMRADYVVIYRAQQQRLAPSPEIVNHYLSQAPETVINIHGVPYAWVYANQRLIHSDVPDEATLTNIGFGEVMRLAGYQLEENDGKLEVALFWHALPPIENDVDPCQEVEVENIETTVCPRINYTISVRLLDHDGGIISQHDGWPVNGLLPTSQWRVGDYVQDDHTLSLPADAPQGEYRLAVVVYHGENGQVLAGPLPFATIGHPP